MTVTYEKIATNTLGSAAASITFSSISGAYTDLVLVINAKTTAGSGNNYFLVRVNSDSGNNYSRTGMYGNGSVVGGFRNSNISSTYITLGDSTTNFGNALLNFMNYSNTTTNKTILHRENNDGATYGVVSLYRSTSALTSITVSGDGWNIATGSTFTLYGILKEA